ncbi:MAG TPA: hypothetical protein VL334_22565 [Anaerolineae bacterium]|nr:hypothetical protein [Anaerolineae bacterium]
MASNQLAPLSEDLLATHGWLTFTDDHEVEDARRRFERRYGERPQYVGTDERWPTKTLKLGPVPGLEVR